LGAIYRGMYRWFCFVLFHAVKILCIYTINNLSKVQTPNNNVYAHLGITTLDGPWKFPGMISAVSAPEEMAPFDRYMDMAPAFLHQVQTQGSA